MGFFDKVKKALGSKKEDVGSQNSVNDEVIDEPTFTESIENNDENLNDNEEIKSSDSEESPANDEITDKSTPTEKIRNFKYLDNLIHSGVKEIVLDSDIILSDDEKSQYENGIRIDVDNLIFDGNRHSIDSKNKTRIFNIYSKVTIKNLTLKNGYAIDGGAINIQKGGDVEIDNCQFQNNTANRKGGAIINWGKLTITETLFNENSTQEDSGGAIYNSGELTIINSTFQYNITNATEFFKGGGAIYNIGKLYIFESLLNQNTAEKGGAIYNFGVLLIKKSIIDENIAKYGGGAIINDSELSIVCSTLSRNMAKFGGAISNSSKCTITDSQLENNTAQDVGGAIYNIHGRSLTIIKSTLNLNKANNSGGAIYNNSIYSNPKLDIIESTIDENLSELGGAIHNFGGNFKISDCTFSNNKSPRCIIENNDFLQVSNTKFYSNQAEHIMVNIKEESNLGIFYGEFIENDNIGESIIFNKGKFCIIEKSIFKNNNSTNNIFNFTELTLINPKINDEGTSVFNDGHILIKDSPQNLLNKIYGEGIVDIETDMIPSDAKFDFGYLDKKIHESTIKEIVLDDDICLENYEYDYYEGGIELEIDDLIINGNGKTIDGADKSRIFLITGNNVTLKNIIFKNGRSHKNYDNSSNNHGGAIKINHNINVEIKNCEFINNESEEDGGAIYNSEGELTITDSKFNENISKWGGAIFNSEKCTLSIKRSTLIKNMAKDSGGAIKNRGELTIFNSTLDENMSEKFGGAIDNGSGDLTINGSILIGNTSNHDGGLISNSSRTLRIIESVISENTSKNYGGAIRMYGGKLIIIDSMINSNKANGVGGVVFSYDAELSITNSEFVNNQSEVNGGAIYLKKSKYDENKCSFKDNKPNDVHRIYDPYDDY